MSAGQEVSPLDREGRSLIQPPLPPDEATRGSPPPRGYLRSGYALPSSPPRRRILILIVAPQAIDPGGVQEPCDGGSSHMAFDSRHGLGLRDLTNYVAHSHTPQAHCVRFAAPLPDAPATLVIGRLARPYPNGTFPRRIALTSPSARRLHRNRQNMLSRVNPAWGRGLRDGSLGPAKGGPPLRSSSSPSRSRPLHAWPISGVR